MSPVLRAEAEDFLFHEAALLDEWKVKEWAALFTDDGEYMIPSTDDPHADPRTTLFLVFDDRHRLEERGKRLMSKAAHAEFPHSRTVHSYSNVRVAEGVTARHSSAAPSASPATRAGEQFYPGAAVPPAPGRWRFRIHLNRCELALEVRPHGKVSIIL
jgi:p-cumate 2,3-dioxygenase beta subunit